jgi:cellulose synthase/poly-beta-1,6-N-acetylglucosamine synthase-like glycosyltransferase
MYLVVFMICAFIVFYTYLGYGMLIYVLARWFPYKSITIPELNAQEFPAVTLFIAAYNEAEIIGEKMANSLALDYPTNRLKIFWVIDGSTDASEEILRKYTNVKVLYSPERCGKTAAINHGMAHVEDPIVVFTDANCMLNKEALKRIVKQFEDPTIGCVAGEKRIAFQQDDTVSSKGESAYWKYESFLKEKDFAYYSAVGAAGELFAIRTVYFEEMPENTLLDDFMLSMRIAQKGLRIAYTPDAYAVERGSSNMEEESKRKQRIAAGGWQSIGRLLPLLNFFVYGRLSFQYVSHRVLRWSIAPIALLVLLPISWLLAGEHGRSLINVFTVILYMQIVFYLCAVVGYLSRNQPQVSKVFFIPYYFVFMNANVLMGIWYLINSTGGEWEKSKRK